MGADTDTTKLFSGSEFINFLLLWSYSSSFIPGVKSCCRTKQKSIHDPSESNKICDNSPRCGWEWGNGWPYAPGLVTVTSVLCDVYLMILYNADTRCLSRSGPEIIDQGMKGREFSNPNLGPTHHIFRPLFHLESDCHLFRRIGLAMQALNSLLPAFCHDHSWSN